MTPFSVQRCCFEANVYIFYYFISFKISRKGPNGHWYADKTHVKSNTIPKKKKIKNTKIHHVHANKVSICGSIDAIGVQIGAGIQKIRRNILHHPPKNGQNERLLAHLVDVGEARSLPLKYMKIQHRWSHVVNFRTATITHLRDQRLREK